MMLTRLKYYFKKYAKDMLYIFSCNTNFLSDAIKSNNRDILFVEYGKVRQENRTETTIELAITIGTPWTETINTERDEAITMEHLMKSLQTIVSNINCQNCGCGFEILGVPELQPVQPTAFFGYLGAVSFIKVRMEEE